MLPFVPGMHEVSLVQGKSHGPVSKAPPLSKHISCLELLDIVYSDGLVAAWGPDHSFLLTTPNANFIPEIVHGVVTVYLRDDGAVGKHDPTQWPQIYVSEYPYLAAIPKQPTLEPNATEDDSPFWNHPSPDHFLDIPNTPVRGFGQFRPDFLAPLEPLVTNMSTKCRQYQPPRPSIEVKPLQQFEMNMSQAWQRLLHTSSTFRDQMLQWCTLRRYWLLCSAFITFYDRLGLLTSTACLPVNQRLMGAWTSDPRTAQALFSLGIPVWLARASHLVTPDVRVARFVGIMPADRLCHVKFHGDEVLYQGVAGIRHLELILESHFDLMCRPHSGKNASGYRDISAVPTARILDPHEYRSISWGQQNPDARTRDVREHRSRDWGGPSGPMRNHDGKARLRPSPCKSLIFLEALKAHNGAKDDRAAREQRPGPRDLGGPLGAIRGLVKKARFRPLSRKLFALVSKGSRDDRV